MNSRIIVTLISLIFTLTSNYILYRLFKQHENIVFTLIIFLLTIFLSNITIELIKLIFSGKVDKHFEKILVESFNTSHTDYIINPIIDKYLYLNISIMVKYHKPLYIYEYTYIVHKLILKCVNINKIPNPILKKDIYKVLKMMNNNIKTMNNIQNDL